MKRNFAVILFGFTLFFMVGCQTGPFAKQNPLQLGGIPPNGGPVDADLAAYHPGPMPAVNKQVNQIPGTQIPYTSRPLGYRRGYQPCNT